LKVKENWKDILQLWNEKKIEIEKKYDIKEIEENLFITDVAITSILTKYKMDSAIITAIDRSDRGWIHSAEIIADKLGTKEHPLTQYYRIPRDMRIFGALSFLLKFFGKMEVRAEVFLKSC